MPEEEKLDPTLGGMLYYHPDTPVEISDQFAAPEGQQYLRNMQQFLGLLNRATPEGYVWRNNSAYRDWGKAHPIKPSHDFVVRRADSIDSDSPPKELSDLLPGIYESAMRLAQHSGMRAQGTAHGSGPHLHTNAGPTAGSRLDDEELEAYLKNIRSRFSQGKYRSGGLIRDDYGRNLF
jgi:hypothetical protein